MKRGDLVTHLTGEWASARRHIGVVLDVRKNNHNQDSALVYLPTYEHQLQWHTIDDWHIQHFWTVERAY